MAGPDPKPDHVRRLQGFILYNIGDAKSDYGNCHLRVPQTKLLNASALTLGIALFTELSGLEVVAQEHRINRHLEADVNQSVLSTAGGQDTAVTNLPSPMDSPVQNVDFNKSRSNQSITNNGAGKSPQESILVVNSKFQLTSQSLPAQVNQPKPIAAPSVQQSLPPIQWEIVNPAVEEAGQSNASAQPFVTTQPQGIAWSLVVPGEEYSDSDIAKDLEEGNANQNQSASDSGPDQLDSLFSQKPKWFFGIGGGARIGIGEPTYPMVYGRIGRRFGNDLALSIRPGYIFGNSDSQGKSNSEGAFQMPLTLDFAPDQSFSPFIGAGIATNTDSNGKTEPLFTAGVDIRITSNLSFAASINVVYQSSDEDNRDVEALTVLYFRF
jgi:opacity protein-like surface antigen